MIHADSLPLYLSYIMIKYQMSTNLSLGILCTIVNN